LVNEVHGISYPEPSSGGAGASGLRLSDALSRLRSTQGAWVRKPRCWNGRCREAAAHGRRNRDSVHTSSSGPMLHVCGTARLELIWRPHAKPPTPLATWRRCVEPALRSSPAPATLWWQRDGVFDSADIGVVEWHAFIVPVAGCACRRCGDDARTRLFVRPCM